MPYESRINQIISDLESGIANAVERAGYRVEAGAKRRARFDTGYMRGQIRFHPGKKVEGVSWMQDPDGRWTFNPSALVKAGKYAGVVIGGANYTHFNEFGTHNSDNTQRMSAQPMFWPATEEVRPLFFAELAVVIKKAVG